MHLKLNFNILFIFELYFEIDKITAFIIKYAAREESTSAVIKLTDTVRNCKLVTKNLY